MVEMKIKLVYLKGCNMNPIFIDFFLIEELMYFHLIVTLFLKP